ncbi:neuraminidase-like domain-containing protein [Chondromyces crocatus]|uniref:Toxin subunit n=1 Tax=Chondromyces crocatus TaxID=52 RepID=A0A0K1ERM9_CHOCO|nr:neuraminidase-like domain-containing protein [Chondromyces crocatus]AKT43565.1 toxin subunit [Chondromyces crocatus]
MNSEFNDETFILHARVIDVRDSTGISGLTVEGWSRRSQGHELLAVATTEQGGYFVFEIDRATLVSLVGVKPVMLSFRIFDDSLLLLDTGTTLQWRVGDPETSLTIEVNPAATPSIGARSNWSVRGKLADSDGNPLQGKRVTAVDRNVGLPDKSLGESTTDIRGRFRITYDGTDLGRPHKARADLAVRALEAVTSEELAKAFVCRAPPNAVVDLTATEPPQKTSEFERLAAAVTPVIGSVEPHELGDGDVDLAACSAEVDRDHLHLFVLAHRMAEGTTIDPEVFYGLLRWGLPTERPQLVLAGRTVHEEALRWAVDENIIPAMTEGDINDALEELTNLAATVALEEERTPGAGMLSDLLATALPDPNRQVNLLKRYVDHDGPASAFWEELRNDPGYTGSEVDKVQLALQLGVLVRYHLPLFHHLEDGFATSTFQSLRELAMLQEDDWIDLLKDDTNGPIIGAPADIPGDTTDERIHHYASVLTQSLEAAFPGAALAGRLPAAPAVLTDALEVLSRVKDFELGQVRIDDFLAANPDTLSGVSQPAVTKAQLKGIDRLYRLTTSTAEISALMETGLDSAQSVVRLGRARMGQLLENKLTVGRIDAIFSAARQVTASSHTLATRYHAAFNGLSAHVLPTPSAPDMSEIASWPALFGSLDFCVCGHCRSVYGPAAYLVDLLQFLHRQLAGQGSATWSHYSIFTQQTVQFTSNDSARDILLARRPDIASIELTCKNTDTQLPYVDLVNEILEYAVANTELSPTVAFPEHIATVGTPAQLAALPQPPPSDKEEVQEMAYQLLAEAPYPWGLPFNIGLEESRIHLDHLGVSRARLMEVLDRSEESRPHAPPSEALTLERLRLSPAGWQLLLGTFTERPWKLYGLLETGNSLQDPTGTSTSPIQGTWVGVLRHVSILLNRTGLTYEALREVLATDFVDPEPKSLAIEAASGADPLTCKIAELRVPALDAAALDRIHRFTRLQRALGWTVAEVDQALSTFGGELDEDMLVHLADVVMLQSEVKIPILEMLTWWGNIQTRTPLSETPSLYEKLFLNQAVTNPVDAALQLNSNGTDLATPLDLATHHAALLSALRCSQAELDLLTNIDAANAEQTFLLADGWLGLTELSRIFRAISMARALSLPVRELLILSDISDIHILKTPIPWDTRQFVQIAKEVVASRWGITALRGLLRHLPSLVPAPTPEPVEVFLDDLKARRHQLVANFVSSEAQESPAPLVRAMVLSRLGEVVRLDAAIIEELTTRILHSPDDDSRSALSVFLDWQDEESGALIPTRTDARVTFLRLEKVAGLLNRLKITRDELRWMVAPEEGEPVIQLDAIPVLPGVPNLALLNGWLTLVRLTRLRDSLPTGKEALAELFRVYWQHPDGPSIDPLPSETFLAALAHHTKWLYPDVETLATRFKNLHPGTRLLRMATALSSLRRLGINAAKGIAWADAATTPSAARATALDIRNTVKAKYDEAQWNTVAKPLRDVLRERQRDALVGYLLWQGDHADKNRLYAELLVDVEMSACQLTSRIAQAISSVQLFVQRCFLHLEAGVKLDEEAAREWKWMRNYRVWEANRKVFLYPENWIEPDLRDNKTPFFKDFENELLQSDLDKSSAEKAYSTYLVKLDQVARLEVMGMVRQKEGSGKNALSVLHVFARTRDTPHSHFYRRREGDDTWSPWEKLDIDIQSDHLIPVVFERRLLLFWAIFETKPSADQSASMGTATDPGKPPTQERHIKLAWSEYQNGKWTSQRSVNAPAIVQPLTEYEDFYPITDFYFRAFNRYPLFGTNNAPALVVEALLGRGQHASEPTRAKSRRLGEFVLSDCRGRWTSEDVTATALSFNIRQPGRARRNRMALLQSASSSDQRLHVLSGTLASGSSKNLSSTGEQLVVLKATPGEFRILFPNSYEDFLSQDAFFYEDTTRSFIVTPRKDPVNRWVVKEDIRFDAVPIVWNDDTLKLELPDDLSPFNLQQESGFVALEGGSRKDELLERWSKSTPEVINIPLTTLKQRYLFEPFHHPYVCRFIKEVNRYGLDGLLEWSRHSTPLQLLRQDNFASRYLPTQVVALPYPVEDVDFSPRGAMSTYNWELFFHAPLLIADRLSKNLRFEEAQRWFHAIFDPTTGSTAPIPQRFWKVRPFFENADLTAIDELLAGQVESLSLQIEAWRRDPFNPHHIARLRPLAYQKTVVMKYIDNLIRWADHLFRQDTVESTTQATQLYVLAAEILGPRPRSMPKRGDTGAKTYRELEPLLDDMSNALVEIESWTPSGTGGTNIGSDALAEPLVMPSMLYFCVPPNDILLGYWDTVADRLFKLRHCMSIDGVVRQLPLFEPPIDPALLVRAAAAGVDLSTVLQDLSAPAPHQRFPLLLQKANEMVAEVKSLGQAFLSAREKRDAEELSLLRSNHELRLLDAIRQIKQQQVHESRESLAALRKTYEATSIRNQFYRDVARFSAWEVAHLTMHGTASIAQAIIQGMMSAAAVSHSLPSFTTGGAGAMGSPVAVSTVMDGTKTGNSMSSGASAANIAVSLLRDGATASATVGGYERRWDDWKLQERVTARELQQIEKQIVAAEIRLAIVEKELSNHELQMEQAREVAEYLRDKFSSQALYDWMSSQLATLYFQSFQLAYDLAKRAELGFRFERGLTTSSFIRFGHWNSLRKGLLAGEALSLDLKRLELAYLEHDKRELELTKQISLLQHAPGALLALKTTGSCTIDLPEQLFDRDFPGHYLRRLKNVSLTLPCVVGPYDGINCTLTLTESKVRHSNVSADATDYLNETEMRVAHTPVSSISTSHAQNDSGLFEVNFRDERYLPFEGAGAISSWKLDLPHECQAFDVGSLSDVILHVRYTARDGGEILRQHASAALATWLADDEGPLPPLAKLVSLRHDFPVAWQALLDPSGTQELTFALEHELFPVPLRGKKLTILRVDLVRVLTPGKTASFSLSLPLAGAPGGTPLVLPDEETGTTSDFKTCEFDAPASLTLSAILTPPSTATALAEELQDILVIAHYTASTVS